MAELPKSQLPNCDIELPVLEDIKFEFESIEVELSKFRLELLVLNFEMLEFEALPAYDFNYRASSR